MQTKLNNVNKQRAADNDTKPKLRWNFKNDKEIKCQHALYEWNEPVVVGPIQMVFEHFLGENYYGFVVQFSK